MDINTLTNGDIIQVEELSGQPFSDLSEPTAPKGKLFAALAYVLKSKEDPSFKYEDALNLPISELNSITAGEPDPKDAAS